MGIQRRVQVEGTGEGATRGALSIGTIPGFGAVLTSEICGLEKSTNIHRRREVPDVQAGGPGGIVDGVFGVADHRGGVLNHRAVPGQAL